jgi:hypothetical protein
MWKICICVWNVPNDARTTDNHSDSRLNARKNARLERPKSDKNEERMPTRIDTQRLIEKSQSFQR